MWAMNVMPVSKRSDMTNTNAEQEIRLIIEVRATAVQAGDVGETADPGEDAHGAPDPMPLWTILDLTPDGGGTDWYPKLEYGSELDTSNAPQ
jgi:predicted dithiol-disulfide oxidoreductase (DUF899 family)